MDVQVAVGKVEREGKKESKGGNKNKGCCLLCSVCLYDQLKIYKKYSVAQELLRNHAQHQKDNSSLYEIRCRIHQTLNTTHAHYHTPPHSSTRFFFLSPGTSFWHTHVSLVTKPLLLQFGIWFPYNHRANKPSDPLPIARTIFDFISVIKAHGGNDAYCKLRVKQVAAAMTRPLTILSRGKWGGKRNNQHTQSHTVLHSNLHVQLLITDGGEGLKKPYHPCTWHDAG